MTADSGSGRQVEQPPVEKEEYEAGRERRDDPAPCDLLLLDPFGTETREAEKEHGEKFGVEYAAEQSRRAVEAEQNPVYHAYIDVPRQNLPVAVPVDVDYHE